MSEKKPQIDELTRRRAMRIAGAAAGGLFLGAGAAGSTLARNPHFIRANATVNNACNLVGSFKVAGLGDNESLTITMSADANATYACCNNGGNQPSDPKKEDVTGTVTATGTFTSGKNGQITGSLTAQPPASSLSCPGGQTKTLLSVTYSNVQFSAPGAGTESVSGTFSCGPGECQKKGGGKP